MNTRMNPQCTRLAETSSTFLKIINYSKQIEIRISNNVYVLLHTLHLYGLRRSCVCECFFKSEIAVNERIQHEHLNDFDGVPCFLVTCERR